MGAGGVEPSSSTVSANHREPLCSAPLLQVASDHRCRVICSSGVQLSALPVRLGHTDARANLMRLYATKRVSGLAVLRCGESVT